MPSPTSPSVVQPGPGKLAAGQATASSLSFSFSGSGDLEAHINDPVDAHMAGAIGIPEVYPPTGEPLLSSAGGPIDGESVLDFIAAMKDLMPVQPDKMGIDGAVPNSGIPNWDTLNTVLTGGFARGGNMVTTHHLVGAAASSASIQGMVFPADRGVLCLYKSTDGDYTNPGTTTLVAALWLGSNPPPSGVPSAAFDESRRTINQLDHSSGASPDLFGLTWRLPYLASYAAYPGAPWSPFGMDFVRYQVARYTTSFSVGAGDSAGSFLLVHWKETYAVTLASIQPAQIAANLNSTHCYSATTPDFDTSPEFNVNRHNVFRETTSVNPTGTTFATSAVGTPTTVQLSGIDFYSNGATPLHWDIEVRATHLFDNSFYTSTALVVMPSAHDPMEIDFSDFGGSALPVHYSDMKVTGGISNFDPSNPPMPGDEGDYIITDEPIWAPVVSASPVGGYGRLRANLRKPFATAPVVTYQDPEFYLFNSYPQAGGSTASTETFEPFVDEKYRYINGVSLAAPNKPLIPAGGDVYDSTVALVIDDGNLQVIGNQAVYPHANFSSGYSPVGANYASVLAGDAADDLRRYVRAFNTGTARNIGKIRIQGLALAAFNSPGAFTGSEVNDHTGGAILQIKVPGSTGWLDLGRVKGDPDLATTDFRGCRTGYSTSGSDITVTYDTTAYTADNGSGAFPLFVRVTFIKNGTGQGLSLDELEWQAP